MDRANPFVSEQEKQGRRFVASFSGGKDSMLAIYRCLQSGMIPVEMITTCPVEADRSWFHRAEEKTLYAVSEAIGIPLRLIKTSGEQYTENFEKALTEAKSRGAEFVVFGDIDIAGHLEWCSRRCQAVGLTAYFPLWQESREALVREFIDSGFTAKMIIVKPGILDDSFLGQVLTHELLEKIAACGADVCGENGEYHTLVLDGPIFAHPVAEHQP